MKLDISLLYQTTDAVTYVTAYVSCGHDYYTFRPHPFYSQAARPSAPAASGAMPLRTASAAPPVLVVVVVVVVMLPPSVSVVRFSVVVSVPDPVGASVTVAEPPSTGAAFYIKSLARYREP